jgi:hypothetical protein
MGSVLIIWEGNGLDATSHNQMKERLVRLERAGFEIVGTTTPAENSVKATEEAEEIRDLKTRIEGMSFHSEDAARAVREWLEEHKHALVLWIRSDAAKHADPWIVGKSGLEPETLKAASKAIYGDGATGTRG